MEDQKNQNPTNENDTYQLPGGEVNGAIGAEQLPTNPQTQEDLGEVAVQNTEPKVETPAAPLQAPEATPPVIGGQETTGHPAEELLPAKTGDDENKEV